MFTTDLPEGGGTTLRVIFVCLQSQLLADRLNGFLVFRDPMGLPHAANAGAIRYSADLITHPEFRDKEMVDLEDTFQTCMFCKIINCSHSGHNLAVQ
eukprot:Skav229857  [mRNA]  locus=scaffold148:94400:96977:- [translate_table: standard]